MRHLFGLIVILAAAAATLAAPAVARAASCSTSPAGGEKTPILFPAGSVSESGSQGYQCTVAWDADVQPQYETGGTWVYCTECAPAFHPNTPDQFWPANTNYTWPFSSGGHLIDSDWTFTPTGSADTPVCKVNWRLQVNFAPKSGFVFQSDVSPTLHKTC